MDGIANHFAGQNELLHDSAYTIPKKVFPGWYLDPAEASAVLGPRHQFILGSPAFPLFMFYEKVKTNIKDNQFKSNKILQATRPIEKEKQTGETGTQSETQRNLTTIAILIKKLKCSSLFCLITLPQKS